MSQCADLRKRLVIERGLEGATTAEHKVEFGFYQLDDRGLLSDLSVDNLFGLVECKKVGVEMTVKFPRSERYFFKMRTPSRFSAASPW